MKKNEGCNTKSCSLEKTLSLVGKKWSLLIIRELLNGSKGFNIILDSVDGICPRILSQRLSELSKNKLVLKEIISTSPLKVSYSLTEEGKGLVSIIEQMRKWGDKYSS